MLFGIEFAKLKIICRQFRVQTQTHTFQIGGAGLRLSAAGFEGFLTRPQTSASYDALTGKGMSV